MSDFIPMVSTTPPPIDDDDDDFGDFMDSTQHEHSDDFADFSSPKDYDDFSYPSINSPPIVTNSASYESGDDEEFSKIPPVTDAKNMTEEDISNDKEVELVMTPQNVEESSNRVTESCNNVTDEQFIKFNGVQNVKNSASEDEASDDWFVEHTKQDEKDSSISVLNEHIAKESSDLSEGPDQRIEIEDTKEDHCGDPSPVEASSNLRTDVDESSASPTLPTESVCISQMNQNTQESDGDEEFCELSAERFDSPEIISNLESEVLSDTAKDIDHTDDHNHNSQDVLVESPQQVPGDENFSDHDSIKENVDSVEKETMESITTDSQDPSFVPTNTSYSDPHGSSMEVSDPHEATNKSEIIHSPTSDDEDNSANDFADFSKADQTQSFDQNSEDDEFADFGAFDASAVQDSGNVNLNSNLQTAESDFGAFENNNTDDPGDGFADFSVATTAKPNTEADSEFADFSTSNDPDDEFVGFSSGSTSDWASFSNTVTKKLTLEEKVTSFISKYTAAKDTEDVNEAIPHLDEHLHNDTLSKDVGSPTASVESMGIVWSGDLWDHLEDIDNTIALSFVWNGSRHNKHLLDALGMRTQNILFSGTKQAYYVPAYYAAGLGMVDPSKGILKPMSAAEKITAMSPTDKNFPNMEDVPTEEAHPEWKTIADEHTSGQGMTVEGSWLRTDQIVQNRDDSEMNSPSKTVPIVSSTMDLDYFDNLPGARENTKPSGGADLIDPELLELTSAPSTEPPPPPKDSGSATLSKILASIKGDTNNSNPVMTTVSASTNQDNSRWEEEESKLSSEARSVLRKLPDLSYMRSKVLIFPMNMSRVHIGEE